ncbi:MAG: tetratricopeptide repeat protein [Planctomycetota bacterium]|nr:tetratricopeptide repeat protein [Planctomycetota bacterium]
MRTFISTIIYVSVLSSAFGDILHFKDGRKLEGEVKAGDSKISIKTRFGSFSFKKSEIARIEKSKTPAQEYEERAAKLGKEDAAGHYSLALWCKSKRLHREMREELELVLILSPDHSGARRALGYKKAGGKWLSAKEAKSLEAKKTKTGGVRKETPESKKEPNSEPTEDDKKKAFTLTKDAMRAVDQRHYDTAIEMLNESLELNSEQPVALYYRGYIRYRLRRIKGALEDLSECIRQSERYSYAYYQRAMTYRFAGDMDKAVADLEAFLKLQPAHSQAKFYKNLFEKVQKGPDWRRTYTRVTRHYKVMTDDGQRLADLAGMELERIYREYSSQFQFKGDELNRKFTVRIFSTKEGFYNYMGETTGLSGQWVAGYYSPTVKELVLYNPKDQQRLIDVIYHEGFHQFLDYFISYVPFWFNEGLAEYFEIGEPGGRRFKLGQVPKQRVAMLKKILADGANVRIGRLVKLSAKEFQDSSPSRIEGLTKVGIHYMESWAFIHFLIHSNRGKYRRVIKDFYLEMKKGRKAEDAFETVFGKANFSRVDRAWREYVQSLGD